MQREKVEFPKRNDAVLIALAYAKGKEVSGRDGPAFMYTTVDDRVLFATPRLNEEIQSKTPNAHEKIAVTRLQGEDNWNVRRVDPTPVRQVSAQPPAAPASGDNNGRSNGNGNGHNPTPAAPSLMTGQSQGMLEQFIAVYEVLVAVEKYAELKGRPVIFTEESFRSTAISCYIAQSRGGR